MIGNKFRNAIPIIVLVSILSVAGFLYANLKDDYKAVGDVTPVEEKSHSAKDKEQNAEKEKIAAPDFIVYDGEGNKASLSDFLGKPVVINFWASWCGFCKEEMPNFQETYDKYGEDVQFMIINNTDGQRETQETAVEYIEKNGYTMPFYYDKDISAVTQYGATGLPMTFIIDKDGNLAGYASGVIGKENLEKAIISVMPSK